MKKLSKITENFYMDPEFRTLVINKLKNALKEEFNAWYGYIIVKEFLQGLNRKQVTEFYDIAAKDELEDHAYWLMKRINELGGNLNDISVSPNSWMSATHPYAAPSWINKPDPSCQQQCNNIPANDPIGGAVDDTVDAIADLFDTDDLPYSESCDENNDCCSLNLVVTVKENLLLQIKNEKGAIETYKELVDITKDHDPVSNAKLKAILADEEEHLQELQDLLSDLS